MQIEFLSRVPREGDGRRCSSSLSCLVLKHAMNIAVRNPFPNVPGRELWYLFF